jgi:hypothetical protein
VLGKGRADLLVKKLFNLGNHRAILAWPRRNL